MLATSPPGGLVPAVSLAKRRRLPKTWTLTALMPCCWARKKQPSRERPQSDQRVRPNVHGGPGELERWSRTHQNDSSASCLCRYPPIFPPVAHIVGGNQPTRHAVGGGTPLQRMGVRKLDGGYLSPSSRVSPSITSSTDHCDERSEHTSCSNGRRHHRSEQTHRRGGGVVGCGTAIGRSAVAQPMRIRWRSTCRRAAIVAGQGKRPGPTDRPPAGPGYVRRRTGSPSGARQP